MVVIVKLRDLRIVALNQAAAGRQPLLRRQSQAGFSLVSQPINGLNQSLAKTRLSNNQGSVVILKRSRDNFRCAGASLVNENNDGVGVIGIRSLGRIRLGRARKAPDGFQN